MEVRRGGRGMMLLALDVGNTNTVMGLYAVGSAEMVASWRIATPTAETADEFGVLLRSLFALRGRDAGEVTAVAVSSVVPPVDGMLRSAFEAHMGVRPLFVEPGVRTGVPVLTDNPAEVGADRIVNCVAAFGAVSGGSGALWWIWGRRRRSMW